MKIRRLCWCSVSFQKPKYRLAFKTCEQTQAFLGAEDIHLLDAQSSRSQLGEELVSAPARPPRPPSHSLHFPVTSVSFQLHGVELEFIFLTFEFFPLLIPRDSKAELLFY